MGTAIGNVASHEAGHYLGNFHVDQFNAVLNLMDQGGNFPLSTASGPTASAVPATTRTSTSGRTATTPDEGFTGMEDTHTRTRWGLHL